MFGNLGGGQAPAQAELGLGQAELGPKPPGDGTGQGLSPGSLVGGREPPKPPGNAASPQKRILWFPLLRRSRIPRGVGGREPPIPGLKSNRVKSPGTGTCLRLSRSGGLGPSGAWPSPSSAWAGACPPKFPKHLPIPLLNMQALFMTVPVDVDATDDGGVLGLDVDDALQAITADTSGEAKRARRNLTDVDVVREAYKRCEGKTGEAFDSAMQDVLKSFFLLLQQQHRRVIGIALSSAEPGAQLSPNPS